MKNRWQNRFKKINKHSIFGFVFMFLFSVLLSFGCSLSLSSKTDFGSQMTNLIRQNNNANEYGQTYWRCEPIESRKDWLGWGLKSYLTSLANPWATYGDTKNNNCFLYTSETLGQTFIKNPATNEMIPISVVASPSSRSLACFDIRLENNKSVNTKYNFYCSKSVANLLNYNLENQELCVNVGELSKTNVSFDGVVDSFGYNFANNFIDINSNFIIVPYICKTEDSEEIISYDMKNYTGQSSFYAVLKNDCYENNYYSLMINNIYQMGGVKDQLCYKATFIDSFEDLLLPCSLIQSNVQNKYINLNNSGKQRIFTTIFGILLILVSHFALYVAITKFRYVCHFLALNSILGSSIGLIVFWAIGEAFYKSKVANILFWDIGSRVFAFAFVIFSTTIFILINKKINKHVEEEIKNIDFKSIKI